jgi:transposase
MGAMSLGRTPDTKQLFQSSEELCQLVPWASLYAVLFRESRHVFPDGMFADLYGVRGRPSVPPRVLAVVMILQRFEGLSDREAVERFAYDVRWKYACGGLDLEFSSFSHSVLVETRARLRTSKAPDRIFDAVVAIAKSAGLVGKKRVFDSTALYDAVTTQDTVTLIRSAIRQVLGVLSGELGREVRAALERDDDYDKPGKPSCDWDNEKAREELVDALCRDAYAVLEVMYGRAVTTKLAEALKLLAKVVGQDVEAGDDGVFRIVHGVAKDRTISTVDPEARHGHKSESRGFDGYKGHIAIDPDSEIIVDTAVTPANTSDAAAAEVMLHDVLHPPTVSEPVATSEAAPIPAPPVDLEVYGDAAYGTAELVGKLETRGVDVHLKVQEPPARDGLFSKAAFDVDVDAGTVRCPEGQLVQIRLRKDGTGIAEFPAPVCSACPKHDACTKSSRGRKISIHAHEPVLQRARARQRRPERRASYRATRPKVERKLAHLVRRKHGGRRARVRGTERIGHDFAMLAAAINLARIAALAVQTRASRATP